MAGRLPDTRRIRVVTAQRGERESLETKGGERESLETNEGERERLETTDGDRERMETSRAEQECRMLKGITELHRTLDSPVNFGPGEEVPHLGSPDSGTASRLFEERPHKEILIVRKGIQGV